jgi:hypothetical protein
MHSQCHKSALLTFICHLHPCLLAPQFAVTLTVLFQQIISARAVQAGYHSLVIRDTRHQPISRKYTADQQNNLPLIGQQVR